MRRRSFLPAVLLSLAILPFTAHNAEALEVEELVLSPAAATWQDALVAHLEVVSACYVGEDVAVEQGWEAGVGAVVTLTVVLDCRPDPPIPQSFARDAVIGHLAPGEYLLRVEAADIGVVHEQELTIHRPADLLLELPDQPVTDDMGFNVTIRGLTGCGFSFVDASVEPGNVLRIEADRNCPILPPGEFPSLEQVEIPPLAAGDWEVQLYDVSSQPAPFPLVHDTLTVYDDQGCVPSDTILCLNDGRFLVTVDWLGFQGGSGAGQTIPLAGRDDTGLFWFFNENNVELTVKVLDGCGVNGHYWVFISSGSTVEYYVRVRDFLADEVRIYDKAPGVTPQLIPDTAAFATCP